jgi:transcriptional regulator with XRE-family HTH domain
MDGMIDDLATWLKRELKLRGWSMREMARRAGVSHTAIINLVNGRTNPSAQFCLQIAEALQMPPEEIYRSAGLLPSSTPEEASLLEANYLFARLSEGEQETVLTIMRALAEKRRETGRNLGLETG